MYIPSKVNDNFGVSLIKRNSKISLNIASKDKEGKTLLINEVDEEFPFSNPLVTSNAVKVFEFIIETNNYIKRVLEE